MLSIHSLHSTNSVDALQLSGHTIPQQEHAQHTRLHSKDPSFDWRSCLSTCWQQEYYISCWHVDKKVQSISAVHTLPRSKRFRLFHHQPAASMLLPMTTAAPNTTCIPISNQACSQIVTVPRAQVTFRHITVVQKKSLVHWVELANTAWFCTFCQEQYERADGQAINLWAAQQCECTHLLSGIGCCQWTNWTWCNSWASIQGYWQLSAKFGQKFMRSSVIFKVPSLHSITCLAECQHCKLI